MDAGKKQLADILNGNRVLEVPYYQRSYVWKEEQWSIDGMPGIVKLAKAEGFKVTTQ